MDTDMDMFRGNIHTHASNMATQNNSKQCSQTKDTRARCDESPRMLPSHRYSYDSMCVYVRCPVVRSLVFGSAALLGGYALSVQRMGQVAILVAATRRVAHACLGGVCWGVLCCRLVSPLVCVRFKLINRARSGGCCGCSGGSSSSSSVSQQRPRVVFVLGGPGAGKVATNKQAQTLQTKGLERAIESPTHGVSLSLCMSLVRVPNALTSYLTLVSFI